MQKQQAQLAAEKLAASLNEFNARYPVPVYEHRPISIPGIGDVFIRQVMRLGYKGEYPRPYDWENLIPQLREGEELLWIVRKRGGQEFANAENQIGAVGRYAFEVYIGLKFTGGPAKSKEEWADRGSRFTALTKHFAKNAFPETLLAQSYRGVSSYSDDDTSEFLNGISRLKYAKIITGKPSTKDIELKDVMAKRDENTRPFSGLNDFLEMHGGPEDNFAIVFSVARVSGQRIQRNFDALFEIRNTIAPLIKDTVQKSEGSSEGWSLTVTESKSKANTDQTTGEKIEKRKRAIGPRMGRAIGNFFRWIGGTSGDDVKEYDNYNYEKKIGVTQTQTTGSSKAETATGNTTKSESHSVTKLNSMMEFADERIKEALSQLTLTLGTGGYSCGAVVYSDRKFTAENLAGAVCATMSGGHSVLHPMRVYDFELPENRDWLLRKKSLSEVLVEDGIESGILNCDKACLYLPVPTTHLVGLPLKKNVFYGKERADNDFAGGITIGSLAFSEAHILGERRKQGYDPNNHLQVQLSTEDFYSHLFVVGTTGCGKTTRVAKLIQDAGVNDFRKIIIETAKKTYWKELGANEDELCIYTLGDSTHNPLRFNPFFFEEGTNLKQHIAVLADAISDLLPMEALIGPKMREAVERCYKLCGWDIETSKHEDVGCAIKYPDITMFNLIVRQIANEMSDYSSEIQGNYKGALLNRAGIFMDSVYQDIFAFGGNRTIDDIFPPDKTVIIEMEEMPPSEINMPAFIVSLLLHRIRAYQNKASNEAGFKDHPGFLIVIEEAHNVLSKSIQDKGDDAQIGKGGHLVKQVTRMLAEGRGLKLGLMIIDQSAANIAPSVITNSNTKLVFRQEDGTEIETIGKAIGLEEKTWNDLQLLERGEYLLRNGKYPQPIKMAPMPDSELPSCKVGARESYVPQAKWIPPYQKCELLLLKYCRGDGLVTKEGVLTFKGFIGESYKKVEGQLRAYCKGDPDLMRYMKVKTLIGKGYFITAESELGI